MNRVEKIDCSEFNKDDLIKEKGCKKVFVVFSTFGEREADLIYDKITLIRTKLADLVDQIFLSHRRMDNFSKEDLTEQKAKAADSKVEIINCERLAVSDMKEEKGKGADMRRALYYLNNKFKGQDLNNYIIVFLDADVVPEHFGEHFIVGLAGAILQRFEFAKASFWRAMGRVKKFVAQPLFSLIEHPELGDLSNLAYPLSGEVAGTLSFFNSVSFWQRYGVETGINLEAILTGRKIADVNLGLYDHEHQNEVNIQKMCFGIMRTYLLQLEHYGLIKLMGQAKISDYLRFSQIDSAAQREEIEFDLSEKKYQPLESIL
jgi:hypothetical protein